MTVCTYAALPANYQPSNSWEENALYLGKLTLVDDPAAALFGYPWRRLLAHDHGVPVRAAEGNAHRL